MQERPTGNLTPYAPVLMHGWQRPPRSVSGSWYLRRITPQVILDARQRLCGPRIEALR